MTLQYEGMPHTLIWSPYILYFLDLIYKTCEAKVRHELYYEYPISNFYYPDN